MTIQSRGTQPCTAHSFSISGSICLEFPPLGRQSFPPIIPQPPPTHKPITGPVNTLFFLFHSRISFSFNFLFGTYFSPEVILQTASSRKFAIFLRKAYLFTTLKVRIPYRILSDWCQCSFNLSFHVLENQQNLQIRKTTPLPTDNTKIPRRFKLFQNSKLFA